MLSPMHMFVIALVAFLLFGNRLPVVMRSLGEGLSEFKRALGGRDDEPRLPFDR